MDPSVLNIVCCPSCRGDLAIREESLQNGKLVDGTILCSQCSREFHVRAGIPILFVEEGLREQRQEYEVRKSVAERHGHSTLSTLVSAYSHHHYIPVTRQAARRFAGQFHPDEWILDIGTGWAFQWIGLLKPNIIAVDFLFDQLLIAKNLLSDQVDRNVHLICADAADLPLKDRTVSGIWDVQALQHLPQGKLEKCLKKLSAAQRDRGAVETYWINWERPYRVVCKLLRKEVLKEKREPFYFRAVTGKELKILLSGYFTGNVTIGYNETIFHPDLRLRHHLPLAWLDSAIGRIPLVNRYLARQVVVRIEVGGFEHQPSKWQ